MKPLIPRIRNLAGWNSWQHKILLAGNQYAASPLFVEQVSQTDEEFERAALEVARHAKLYDPEGKTRDVAHGARAVDTKALGPVTRQWIDSNVEIDFLDRHLPIKGVLNRFPATLDVGAGYGRFAVSFSPYCDAIWCTDAVAAAYHVCVEHTRSYDMSVEVVSPEEIMSPRNPVFPKLAVNIHSWNECNMDSIDAWLDLLQYVGCDYLFTVSHGTLGKDAYLCHDIETPSFRCLLEERYDLLAEESLGLSGHPYSLWARKVSVPSLTQVIDSPHASISAEFAV